MRNPLMERYSYPLGAPRDEDRAEVAEARKKALANIEKKLNETKDEVTRRKLQVMVKKLGGKKIEI